MRAALLFAVVSAGMLMTSAVAEAGVLSGGECFRNLCSLKYRGLPREANRVTLRTIHHDELLLTDTGAVILNETVAYDGCRTLSAHSALCLMRSVEEFPGTPARIDFAIRGGNGGDVIDARGVTQEIGFWIAGGTGNDKLYAAKSRSENTLVPGGGRDLLVGNRFTNLDFENVTGPLMVNLLQGVAVAPHEHARILGGVAAVKGGRGTDRLIGGKTPGTQLQAGPGHNYLVSNVPGTKLDLGEQHLSSTIVCGQEASVFGLEANDLALGGCRTEDPELRLMLPLTRLASPVIELPNSRGSIEPTLGGHPQEASLRAVPSGTLIGQVSIPPSAPLTTTADCYLSAAGRAIVKRTRRLVVRVEADFPSGFTSEAPPILKFMTVITRP